jgi:hypothetical protein
LHSASSEPQAEPIEYWPVEIELIVGTSEIIQSGDRYSISFAGDSGDLVVAAIKRVRSKCSGSGNGLGGVEKIRTCVRPVENVSSGKCSGETDKQNAQKFSQKSLLGFPTRQE